MPSTPTPTSTQPLLRHKLALWLVLGLFSAAIPEVVSGSSPFVLFTPWGLLVTVPLYLLHAVFLAGIVHRFAGGLGWRSLYLAGALFGLYEAYLTKVLWAPTWDPIPVTVGGVYAFVTVVLVLLWHPLLAFVLPLLSVERLCTSSRLALDGLPRGMGTLVARSPRGAAIAEATVLGLVQGAIAPEVGLAVASGLGTAAVLVAAVVLWRRLVGVDRYTLSELLPDGRELLALGGLLVVLYVAFGVGLRPEHLPGLPEQATVWVLYLVLGGLLALQLRSDRRWRATVTVRARAVPLGTVVRVAVGYVVAVGIGSLLLGPVVSGVHVALLLVAVPVGTLLLGRIVLDLGRGRQGSPASH